MEWVATLVTALVVVILVVPVLTLLATIFVLAPLAHLAPPPVMVTRRSLDCPSARRRARVSFLTAPGSERPVGVQECSVFPDGRIRCKKRCLEMTEVRWAPSPMTPRAALIAGGEAFR